MESSRSPVLHSVLNPRIVALEAWLQTELGHYVVRLQSDWLSTWVPDCFGLKALQVGSRMVDVLQFSRIPDCSYIPLAHLSNQTALPYEDDSLDVLALPHALEVCDHPEWLLAEAARVLRPEGRFILTGLNRFSSWALLHRFWPKLMYLPTGARPWSVGQVRDVLLSHSIEPERGRFMAYGLPSIQGRRVHHNQTLEYMGDRWWPAFAAIYGLCAVKRIAGMRLVGHAFKKPVADGATAGINLREGA